MKQPKETYFSHATLHAKARQMMQALEPVRRNPPLPYAPERSALLALDLQAYFLDESSHAFIPRGAAILPGVNALVRACSRRGLPVFLTHHLNTPQNAGLMSAWWRDLLTEENPSSALDPRLERGTSIEVRKTRYDAFLNTPLETLLRERAVNQVEPLLARAPDCESENSAAT